jgi:1,6-anhydro-N-acetylmuramate kinase
MTYDVRAVPALGRRVDLIIDFHSQTILHQPDWQRTWRIGDVRELAWRSSVPVTYAPVRPMSRREVRVRYLRQYSTRRDVTKPPAVLNIGDVSNVTWMAKTES